jgi:hypothetical protein
MAAEYVVTLVHGTWADTKGWVARGSFLRRELERGLRSVAFRRFSWTGANTHAARIAGGARLALFIRDGHAQYPDAKHFVIAHSHGGNVALYAMRDSAARDAIDGIVTLATPFIQTRRRVLHRHVDVIAWLILAVAIVSVFVALQALTLGFLAVAWIVLGALVMVKLTPALSEWLVGAGRLEQADVVAEFEPPAIDPARLLILCAQDDEATRWLRTWDAVAQAPFVVAALLFTVFEFGSRSSLVVIAEELSRSAARHGLGDISAFRYDGWALGVGLMTVCLIWSVVLLFSAVMNWPGYWREPLRANLFVEMAAKSTPRAMDGCSHTTYTFDVALPSLRSRIIRGFLRHSAIYEHPDVVSAAVNWISHRARPSDREL